MAVNDTVANSPLAQSLLKFLESETQKETEKIMKKYQDLMVADLEQARARIVAQAGVRLSELMTIQDMGRVVRIEIIKREEK